MTRVLCAVAAACGLLVACADASPGTVHLYDPAPVPAVPDRTREVDPHASTVADGQYWATLTGGDQGEPPVLAFRLTQAFFAATCIDELGADACTDGYGTLDDPSRIVNAPIEGLTVVTVAGENQQNYAVTGDELFTIGGGGAPASDAPAGFTYVAFPYLVTVRGGTIVEAHQIWVP